MSISALAQTPQASVPPQPSVANNAEQKPSTWPKYIMTMAEREAAIATLKPMKMPFNPELAERILQGLENLAHSADVHQKSDTRSLAKYETEHAAQTQLLKEKGPTSELKNLMSETATAINYYKNSLDSMRSFDTADQSIRNALFKFTAMLTGKSLENVKDMYQERLDKSA